MVSRIVGAPQLGSLASNLSQVVRAGPTGEDFWDSAQIELTGPTAPCASLSRSLAYPSCHLRRRLGFGNSAPAEAVGSYVPRLFPLPRQPLSHLAAQFRNRHCCCFRWRWRGLWGSTSRSSEESGRRWTGGGSFKLACFLSTGTPRPSSRGCRCSFFLPARV